MLSIAAGAEAAGAGFKIFGAVGFSGAALVMTAVLVYGIRGNGRIKFNHESAVATGFITGQLYAMAGQFWAFAGDMSNGLSQAIRQGFGEGGTIGAGAVALLLGVTMYGTKLKRLPGVVLGVISPPIFTAAGGLFAILTTLLSTALTTAVG
jgi:ABC-type glucose/galactose transport system permease subunit